MPHRERDSMEVRFESDTHSRAAVVLENFAGMIFKEAKIKYNRNMPDAPAACRVEYP